MQVIDDLTIEKLMSMPDQEFFANIQVFDLNRKKQIEKGLEIELHRLNYTKTALKQELTKWTESERDSHLKSLLELETLFTRMQIRASYTTYILRKEAQELMARK